VGAPSGKPEALRKRAGNLRKLRQERPGKQGGKSRPKKRRRPVRHRFGTRTDDGPIALRAFWSMHVEAMNWSGMGHAEYAAALGLSPHALRKWRDRFEDSKVEMDWRSLLHPSAQAQLSSAANCAAALATLLPGLVRPPDGMMAIELEMGSEPRAKTGRLLCRLRDLSPLLHHSRHLRCPKKTGASESSLDVAARKNRCGPSAKFMSTKGGSGCWRRNFGIESGAHGRHFNAGKLAKEHDAAGLLCTVGQQKPVPNTEDFCSVDRRPRDGLRTRTAIPTCNRKAAVEHND
jgi:hypothetical protein